MDYRVQNSVSRPNVDDFRHPTWTYHKVLKKCPKNAGKMRGKIIFSRLWCLIQKLDHNSGLHEKIREKSLKTKYGNVDIPL